MNLKGAFYIDFVIKNKESINQYFFPRTMISRLNFLPHCQFHYLFLIDSLWFMFRQRSGHLQPSVHDKPCDTQVQRFVAKFVLHSLLMSSIIASDVGCWSIQLRDNTFFSMNHPRFSADGRPNINWRVRFQTAVWTFALWMCFCKVSFVCGSWWHWMLISLFTKQKEPYLINITNWRKPVEITYENFYIK